MGFSIYSTQNHQFKILSTAFLSKPSNIMFTNNSAYTVYYIVQNFGRGKLGKWNAIRQYLIQPNSRFTKVTNVSYCKFNNIFPHQNSELIEPPKFYAPKIFRYTVWVTLPGHNSLVSGPIGALFVLMPQVFEGLHVDMQFVMYTT